MFGGRSWRHLCIVMQRMFAEDTPWHVDWMEQVRPQIEEISGRYADVTVFTRFVPPIRGAEAPGAWRQYFEKWSMMTREHLPHEMVDILPIFRRMVPPAQVFDKRAYSPWADGRLHQQFQREYVEGIVLTGGETDVCVLATAFGAMDLGYRILVLSDAVCSGADETHDAALKLLQDRFSLQLDVCTTDEFLSRL